MLVWKIFNARLDGFENDDLPSEPEPGAGVLAHAGQNLDTGNRIVSAGQSISYFAFQSTPKDTAC